jgi:hypothetical protein
MSDKTATMNLSELKKLVNHQDTFLDELTDYLPILISLLERAEEYVLAVKRFGDDGVIFLTADEKDKTKKLLSDIANLKTTGEK